MAHALHRVRGDVLRALRLARGITAATLAAAAGIDAGHMSRIESGTRTGARYVDQFATTLHVSPDVLIGRTPALPALRDAAGITAATLAADLDITPRRLGRIESGAEIPDDALTARLAVRLGVPASVVQPTVTGAAA